MASAYKVLRGLYRGLIPASVRKHQVFENVSLWIAQRVTTHSELYSETYFQDIDHFATKSAPVVAGSMIETFGKVRVIDVGCGTGALLAALRDRGCSCFGLEYADAGLEKCRARGLEVRKFDLERESPAGGVGVFDAAVCMEVAEHLPERCADRLVEVLTSLAPVVIFTAATPGQGGLDHVNEQPHEYWIEKFRARGFDLSRELMEQWSRAWERGGVESFYYKNLMIFRRAAQP